MTTPGQMRALALDLEGEHWKDYMDSEAADALRTAADQLEVVEVTALRDAAAAARAAWAPEICPWVGFLEDRADRIDSGKKDAL